MRYNETVNSIRGDYDNGDTGLVRILSIALTYLLETC
jgi:hypothetical protein